ncbi:MAG: hypothetical protein CVV25_04570 [Ignavibacteriae bacterium HGW-Ignavibacteriae-4]|jgi:hypothetical protein|nr:MAG: hypothetical protein CVV25_04570 [Ignavibacteriae bacterium HGW-Ignavibacteriae-4]
MGKLYNEGNMNNDIIENINEGPKNGGRFGTTIILVIDLLLIAFSFLIFNTAPSLGYLVILYGAIAVLVLGVIISLACRDKIKERAIGLISIGVGIAIGVASGIDIDNNEVIMTIGQIVTGVSFFLISYLIYILWRK